MSAPAYGIRIPSYLASVNPSTWRHRFDGSFKCYSRRTGRHPTQKMRITASRRPLKREYYGSKVVLFLSGRSNRLSRDPERPTGQRRRSIIKGVIELESGGVPSGILGGCRIPHFIIFYCFNACCGLGSGIVKGKRRTRDVTANISLPDLDSFE